MTDAPRLPPLLHGLFRELVANGVPIGIRDYLDGVRALRLGHGADFPSRGEGARQRLCTLAQALWARSDEERRLIARWFARIPEPPPALLDDIDGCLAAPVAAAPEAGRAAPSRPDGPAPLRSDDEQGRSGPVADSVDGSVPRARVSFGAAQDGGGLPIPRLPAAPHMGEDYILNPQTLIGSRDLAVLWRRYRRGTRRGPSTELDLAATVRERCRRGLLLAPVCRPRRSNNARLLILVDSSPSMDPWRPFLASLVDSLRLGRLREHTVRYFANQPRKQLFERPELRDPQARDEVLRRHAGAGLLIVSDAGSARGFLNRRRVADSTDFLAEAVRHCPAAVWLNPMPAGRWKGTTAARIAADGGVPMLPLDAAHLLRAIDILRGTK